MKGKSREFFLYMIIGILLMVLAHLFLYVFGWVGNQFQVRMPGYLFLYPSIYAVAAYVLAHRERWAWRLAFILLGPVYYWVWNYVQGMDRMFGHPFIMKSVGMEYVLGITVLFAYAIGYVRRRRVLKN